MIATAARPDLLARTLKSLAECERPGLYRGTIVIENGAKRGAADVVRAAPSWLNCRYLYQQNGNKSVALNLGLAHVPDDCLVVFTDDDVRFDSGVLTGYASASSDSLGHYFGGPTGVDYEQEPPKWLKRYLPESATGWTPGDPASEALSFLGFNWAAFSADVRRAGGFNPNRGPGAPSGSTGQESDMQRRLRLHGIVSQYVPSARVWHYVPAERSTPDWVVERLFRHGVACAMQAPESRLRLGGCPPWTLGRVAKGIARSAVACVYRDPVFRFDARAKISYNRGLVHGFRQRARSRSSDNTAKAGSWGYRASRGSGVNGDSG